MEEIVISEDPNYTHNTNDEGSGNQSVSADSSVANQVDMWEQRSRLVIVLSALLVTALIAAFSVAFGTQAHLGQKLAEIVVSLVILELARVLLVHAEWPFFRSPAAQRLAEVLGFLPTNRSRRRSTGPRS
jgi:hypothetical protein